MPKLTTKWLVSLNKVLTLRYSWYHEKFSLIFRLLLALVFGIYILSLGGLRGEELCVYVTALLILAYLVLQTLFLWHAKRRGFSLMRLMISGLIDVLVTTYGVGWEMKLSEHFPISFWIYLVIIVGNTLRYSPLIGASYTILTAVAFYGVTYLVLHTTTETVLPPLTLTSGLVGLTLVSVYVVYYSVLLNQDIFMDPLTGVHNRQLIAELQKTGMTRDYKGLLLIDLNGFKAINDKFGHLVGDKALIKVAKILRDTLRGEDIIIRWGGDEFLILIPSSSNLDALKRRLKEKLAETYLEVGKSRVPLRVSVGTSDVESFSSLEEAIKHADENMY